MGIIETLLGIATSAVALWNSLFGKKGADQTEDAATKAVKMSNEAGKLSAEVTRASDAQLHKDTQNVDDQTAADVDRLRAAGSVRERSQTVADAIARANKDADTDGGVPRT